MRRVFISLMLILSVLALMCGSAGAVSSSAMQLMADFAQKGIDTFFRDWYYPFFLCKYLYKNFFPMHFEVS